MSLRSQTSSIQSVVTEIKNVFDVGISDLVALAEYYRLQSQVRTVTEQELLPFMWAQISRAGSGVYVTNPATATSTGYWLHATRQFGIGRPGLLTLWNVNVRGEPIGPPAANMTNFDPFDRSWYAAAVAAQGYATSQPHVSAAGVPSLGVGSTPIDCFFLISAHAASAVPVYTDLQPVPGYPDPSPPNGPVSNPRVLQRVFGLDQALLSVSVAMAGEIDDGNTMGEGGFAGFSCCGLTLFLGGGGLLFAFYNPNAYILGTSDLNDTLSVNGRPARTTEMDDPLLNATMKYWLAMGGIAATDYARYAELPPLVNRYINLLGTNYIVTTQRVTVPTANTTAWVVLLTPRSAYFSKAEEATQTSLLVIFLCVIPVTASVAALLTHFFVALPSRRLARGMEAIALRYDFTRDSGRLSRVQEINAMQRAYRAMQTAMVGFSKFAPIHVVRQLLANNIEARLEVAEGTGGCVPLANHPRVSRALSAYNVVLF